MNKKPKRIADSSMDMLQVSGHGNIPFTRSARPWWHSDEDDDEVFVVLFPSRSLKDSYLACCATGKILDDRVTVTTPSSIFSSSRCTAAAAGEACRIQDIKQKII